MDDKFGEGTFHVQNAGPEKKKPGEDELLMYYSVNEGVPVTEEPHGQILEIGDINKEKRDKNAHAINSWQARCILGTTKDILIPNRRCLVFYFRGGAQGACYRHYKKIIEALSQYIKSGESLVYSDFKIVCRHAENIKELKETLKISDIEISVPQELGFLVATCIYADTIHLNRGSLENIPGTIPILGTATTTDKNKMSWLPKGGEYTKVDLLYYGGEHYNIVQRNTGDYDGIGYPLDIDSETICKRMLDAVRENENKLLDKIGETFRSITENTKDGTERLLIENQAE